MTWPAQWHEANRQMADRLVAHYQTIAAQRGPEAALGALLALEAQGYAADQGEDDRAALLILFQTVRDAIARL